jgi:glycosyltransferase involved in cell wall biosynthesis
LRKPLVIDLHDPWALDEMLIYPTWVHRRLALRTMRQALDAADGIVMSTPEARNRVLHAFPELRSKPVVVGSNGFDRADFEGPAPQRDDEAFRIVHTGYLHTELGLDHRRLRSLHRLLGGSMIDVDILTRSHVFLLEAVENLVQREPDLAPIEIHLAGVLSESDRKVATHSSTVRLHGYVSHAEAVGLMRSADLLFLPMHELPEGRRVGIIPGKTFEYLASGTPILAAIPEGDARDLLIEAGNAFCCRPSDVDAMASSIAGQIRHKRSGLSPPEPDEDVVRRSDWRERTKALGELFDVVLNGAPRDAEMATLGR